MFEIGYRARICDDDDKIKQFLVNAQTGIVAMQNGEFPYAVPVNFVYYNNSIYFHGMGSGKKYDILKTNPNTAFTVYEKYGTVKGDMPCHADTAYFSVMIFGKAQLLTDYQESADALQKLVEKYMPNFFKTALTPQLMEKYHSQKDNMPTAVYKISIGHITAKQNIAKDDELF